jgi:peroxiredoxin Q/BCP
MAKAAAKKTSKNKKTSKASRKRSRIPSRKKKPAKKISKKILKKKPTKKKVSKAPTRKKKLTPKKVAKKKSSLPKLQKASLSKSVAVESKKTLSKPELKEGDMAPLFELRDQSGRLHALSEYRGKNIVLYFYPKDDTPGCTKEACQFRDDLHHYNQLNTLIFGVSFDDEASHQKFIEKFQLNFPLLADIEKKAAEAYGVYVEKSMYGRTYMGIERSTFIIDKEGRLAKIFRGVSVDGHSAELLNELKKLS